MLAIEYTNQFKRDLRLAKKRNKKLEKLQHVMGLLVRDEPLPEKYRAHELIGKWAHYQELHVEPDWLLIYQINYVRHVAIFVRTGSHADLF